MLSGSRLMASTYSLMPLRSSSRPKNTSRHTSVSTRSEGASSIAGIRFGSGSLHRRCSRQHTGKYAVRGLLIPECRKTTNVLDCSMASEVNTLIWLL